MYVYLLATLDTKGPEARYARDRLVAMGRSVRVVDCGAQGTPAFVAEISREQVFHAAGSTLLDVLACGDRGHAVTTAAAGAARIVAEAHARGEVAGVLGLGGSAGTTIATVAMRRLPLETPKVMISTLASGNTRPFVGDKNIVMINPVVDIAGVNRISRVALDQAAAALAGMLRWPSEPSTSDRPMIAATMFGVTTPCVQTARTLLENAGYEVLVFHATGAGGQAMESLIRDGAIAGVLDVTTTELADELVGGILSAGPERLTAAGERGIPQVVSLGALDMVNFGPLESVPEKFRNRLFHQHNASVMLMRTTPEENAVLGREIAAKLAKAKGPTRLLVPLQGVSAIDRAGQPFDDPVARAVLIDSLRMQTPPTIYREIDAHVNDAAFAEALVGELLGMMAAQSCDKP